MERPRPQEQGLYRERPSSTSYVDYWMEKIQAVETGQEKLDLSEDEITEILESENELGEKLEGLYEIKVNELKLNVDYFLTDDGKKELADLLEISIEEIPKEKDVLISFIYQNDEKIAMLSSKTRKDLSGNALSYEKKRLQKELESRFKERGELFVDGIKISERIGLVLNPETLLEKDKGLRELKEDIKLRLKEISDKEVKTAKDIGMVEIYEMYIQRINILITNNYPYKLFLSKKAEIIGLENLTETEKSLIHAKEEMFWGQTTERRESQATRIDKFVRGAESISLSESGPWRKQLSKELEQYTASLDRLWLANEQGKYTALREKGLDPEKILDDKAISPETRIQEIRELYEEMGLLSTDTDYDIDRPGPAEDNKWQVEAMPGRKAHSIIDKQKAHLVPDSSCEVVKYISVDLGHEPVHVIQHENKSTMIPLRLFEKVGGGRHSIFTEGGAKMVESELSLELFGYENVPHPHYMKAVQERVNGGNYLDTVKVFFQSAIRPYETLLQEGGISKEKYNKKVSFQIKLAIDRCRRLFRGGGELDSNSGMISSTGSMVYVEQKSLFDKIKGTPLESIFFIAGVSLENYYRLAKLGFIEPGKIIKPNLEKPHKEWADIIDRYRLELPTS